jgi:hypothetical protein
MRSCIATCSDSTIGPCFGVGQLANGFASLGVKPGNIVAIMDGDSDRYLECFFGMP